MPFAPWQEASIIWKLSLSEHLGLKQTDDVCPLTVEETMAPIKVLVADDHTLFRQGLIRILQEFEQVQVVGEASNGQEALTRVAALRPDVVLMDLNMPVMSGSEATRRIFAQHPQVRVIMLTVSSREEDLFEAIKAGAQGYLLKNAQTAELVAAIQQVHAGEAIVAPPMAARLVEEFRQLAQRVPVRPDTALPASLSEREAEVLRLVAQGLANKEIAQRLGLSEHTVKSHLRNILDKLHLRSRAHAAAYAVQTGLVQEVKPEQ